MASASEAWQGWMNSASHRKHLLGQDSFYAGQTHYGVGFVSSPGSPYRYYWVVITAPPAPDPDLAITSPSGGARLADSGVTVTGTAASDSGVATVEARVENGEGTGAYSPAIGTTNWRANVTGLAPGVTRSACAEPRFRRHGDRSVRRPRNVTYVVMSNLTVALNGSGTVTAGFAGTTSREVGRQYEIKATPAAGYLFTGWTGDATAAGRTLKFTMSGTFSVQANFVPNYFVGLKGVYRGLIESGSAEGMIRVTLTDTGLFTGKISLVGGGAPFSGRFGTDGSAAIEIPRGGGAAPLTVAMQLDLLNANGAITGTVSDGTTMMNFSADRATYNAANNPAPAKGRYTVRLRAAGSQSGDALPAGDGFATLVIGANGRANLAGRLADDTRFTRGGALSHANELVLYVPLAAGQGAVVGSLSISEISGSPVTGALEWMQPVPGESAQTFTLNASGSSYASPAPGAAALDIGTGLLALGGGDLPGVTPAEPIVQTATFTPGSEVAVAAPNDLEIKLTVNRKTGVMAGKLRHPVSGKLRPIRGVVLQNQESARGYFLGTEESGSVALTAP